LFIHSNSITTANDIEVGDAGIANRQQGKNLALSWHAAVLRVLRIAGDQTKKH